MFPDVFWAVPLLLSTSHSVVDTHVDIVHAAPIVTSAASDKPSVSLLPSGSLIPPLYAPADGGFVVSLSPGSPCTAACVRLQVRF